MNNINYQTKLDAIISDLAARNLRPSLLLHSCCGPCSSYVVTYLKTWFDITVLYYNPNIYPEEEYAHRLAEQKRLLRELCIPILEVLYDHREFVNYVSGLEAEREGGARCERCFELRLRKTMELAREQGFAYFATTLTVSPHKNAMVINRIGQELEEELSTDTPLWLPSDFKKKDGYKKSIELTRKYDLYRQDYCGCEFAHH